MHIKIENLKKSERGIEVTGWVPTPSPDRTLMPNIPRSASMEERTALLAPYYDARKEANEEYIAAKRLFEQLHLGDAELVQAKVEADDNK